LSAMVKSSMMAMKDGIGDSDDDFCDGDERWIRTRLRWWWTMVTEMGKAKAKCWGWGV
jgi:hypothetical protein